MSQVEQDLAYVKAVVQQGDKQPVGPRSIYLLWAIVYLVGFALYDVDMHIAGLFWMIAGPLGGVASYLLGRRWALRSGRASRRVGTQHLLHWGGMTAAVFLIIPLLPLGVINGDALAKLVLLVVAFGLFTAGIYLVRAYAWIGLALTVCYLGVMAISELPWTVVGVIAGGAMLAAAVLGHRADA